MEIDIGTVFIGIVLLVIAWAVWMHTPPPINIIGGLIFGLIGLYFVLVGLVGDLDGRHVEAMVPFLLSRKLASLR